MEKVNQNTSLSKEEKLAGFIILFLLTGILTTICSFVYYGLFEFIQIINGR